MNTDFEKIRQVFLAIVEQPSRQWAALLDGSCGNDPELRQQVALLLKAHAGARGILDQGMAASAPTEGDAPLREATGAVIGPYKLLQQIGEGGMGAVFMAEQTQPIQRKVAVKVIKAGMDSRQVIARFEAERQALAMMDHVNIARVFDAGTTESGRPYFVMELVHGVPITKYCDDNHLTPRERLELFVPVCQAIQHAHQKGIIHRDIKPSNVMITLYDGKPVPKVIDFGVAKATEQKLTERTLFTQYGTLVGTLEYMSPEQAEMSALGVDTRSDIYSLGVLLYELLTGGTPLTSKRMKEAAYAEILRMIKEEEPPRPSTRLSDSGEALASISAQRHTEPAKLSKLMRGELDWIVMKTLEKDRNRRYETANGFAADVQCYLNDEPVQACPPSALYRYRKFARRNKRALMTATVLIVAGIVVAATLGWGIRDREARNAQIANERVARQAKLAGDLQVALERAELFHGQGKRREALAAFERAEHFATEAMPDPAIQERLAALKERLDADAQDHAFVTEFEAIRLEQSRVDEVQSRFAVVETLSRIKELFQKYGIEIGVSTTSQAVARIQRRPEAIQGHLHAALDECLQFTPTNDVQTVRWLIAVLKGADGDPWRTQVRKAWATQDKPAFEQLARQVDVSKQQPSFLLSVANVRGVHSEATSLELLRRIQRAYPADFWANEGLASTLRRRGQSAEAIRYFTAALALRPDNPGVYLNRSNALKDAGELDTAIADLRRGIALAPAYAMLHYNLGIALREQEKVDEAIVSYRKAIELDPKFSLAHYNLGIALGRQGKLDEAIASYKKAIELDPEYAMAHTNLGAVLHDHKKPDEAIACFRKAIELEPKDARVHHNLGAALRDQGKLNEAIASFHKAIELDPKLARAHYGLGNALHEQGMPDEAIACFRKAIELDPKNAMEHGSLGDVLMRQGKVDEAVTCYRKAIELDPKFAMAHSNLGSALDDQGEVDQAIACYRKAIELDPKLVLVHFNLGNSLHNQNKLDEAIDCFRKAIELDPKFAMAHSNLGVVLKRQGKVDEAIDCFRKAIELDPKFAIAHSNLGSALHVKGEMDQAIMSFRKAIEFDPKDAMAHTNLGTVLGGKGQHDEAIVCHRKAITLDPKFPLAHSNLAAALHQKGKLDEAIACYCKAIELDPKNADSHNGLAWLLATAPDVKLRDPKRAVELALNAVELDPKNPSYPNTLGVAHYRAGEWKAAVASLAKSMELHDGGDSNDWFFLAMAHWQLGEKEKAREWYDRAVAWLEKNNSKDDELRRFREEAAKLLKIEDQ